jgi:hypothetical protein
MESLRIWIDGTAVSTFMTQTWWAWRVAESLHFMGVCLLLGTVGMFDLRLIGLVQRVPIPALHQLLPWGIFGYCINVATGILFFAGAPDQYMYNPSFQLKMLSMALAGLNVVFFYLFAFRKVEALEADDEAPWRARIIGMASLLLWIAVVACGRLITFYRPPHVLLPVVPVNRQSPGIDAHGRWFAYLRPTNAEHIAACARSLPAVFLTRTDNEAASETSASTVRRGQAMRRNSPSRPRQI